MKQFTAITDSLPPWANSALILLALAGVALGFGFLFERLVIAVIRRLVSATKTQVDDIIVQAAHPAMALLAVTLSFHAGLRWAGTALPASILDTWSRLTLAFGVVVAAIILARLVGGLLRHWSNRQKRWGSVASLSTRIVNVIVYVVAGLVILGSYGVSITPLITSLGIAGLAVALALQDTLSNFFAGVWIQGGQALRPGHYVKLEGQNLEGYVDEIGWRTTRIRQLSNNIILVPNAKLAQAIVIDYHLPEPRMSLLIPISVGYECDPRRIERVLVEEAKGAAKEVPGLLADPEPFVRFIPGFGDYALQFTLICQVKEYVDQYHVQHELRMRILERFHRESIRIPYPLRESYMVPPTRADVAARPPGN